MGIQDLVQKINEMERMKKILPQISKERELNKNACVDHEPEILEFFFFFNYYFQAGRIQNKLHTSRVLIRLCLSIN